MDDKQRDLLGQLMAAPLTKPHKSKRREPVPRGYAWAPGTGPAGETCKSCRHLVRKQWAKTYLKCGLMQAKWTCGGGSDVRARSPACKFWEATTATE